MKIFFQKCSAIMTVAVVFISCSTQYAITEAGENLSALTKVTENSEPCINPYGGDNGKNLFYAAREKKGYFNIYKKDDAFSTAVSQKTSGKNFNFYPAYNAATDRIAFRGVLEGMLRSDIYAMSNAKGNALSKLTETSDASESRPCFSSDGKFLVYDKTSSYDFGGTVGTMAIGSSSLIYHNREIWMKNLENGETMLLTTGIQPSFSPDGKKIVFSKETDILSSNIWIMDSDGSNPIQITHSETYAYATCPRFSPDGQKIVFVYKKRDKKDCDIYIVDVDGNNLTQLTINKSFDSEPYWTTDNYIYFTSDRGGKKKKYQIWRFKL